MLKRMDLNNDYDRTRAAEQVVARGIRYDSDYDSDDRSSFTVVDFRPNFPIEQMDFGSYQSFDDLSHNRALFSWIGDQTDFPSYSFPTYTLPTYQPHPVQHDMGSYTIHHGNIIQHDEDVQISPDLIDTGREHEEILERIRRYDESRISDRPWVMTFESMTDDAGMAASPLDSISPVQSRLFRDHRVNEMEGERHPLTGDVDLDTTRQHWTQDPLHRSSFPRENLRELEGGGFTQEHKPIRIKQEKEPTHIKIEPETENIIHEPRISHDDTIEQPRPRSQRREPEAKLVNPSTVQISTDVLMNRALHARATGLEHVTFYVEPSLKVKRKRSTETG